MPVTFCSYLRCLATNNWGKSATSEFIVTNWLLLFYEKVHLAGHFTDYNNEQELLTYYGAKFKTKRLDIKNELKVLQKLENKIILL